MENAPPLPDEMGLPNQPPGWRWFAVLMGAMSITLGIGWVDYITEWDLSLYLFYVIPIFLVIWHDQRKAAVFLAIFSGLVWWLANNDSNPYHSEWNYRWVALSRTIYFVLVALGGSAVRARIEALERSKRLEREIVMTSEREQQRIGQDLHDGLCQHLAAIGCAARSLADDLRLKSLPEARDAEQIEALLKDAVAQTRDLAHGISPVRLDGGSLSAALAKLAAGLNRPGSVSLSFNESGDVQIADPETAMHLYRISQEAVGNAMRHSGARRIVIGLRHEGDAARLTVEDDGTGILKGADSGAGMGLKTMSYRARLMGAEMAIQSDPSHGTTVSCLVHNRNHNSPQASGRR